MEIRKIRKDEYPFLLRQTSQLTETMDVIGELPPEHFRYLCVVGSRLDSEYGREVCRKLISGLEGYPITIVSGMAVGIDSIAHEAALATKMHTIAFPGSGLAPHVLYPSSRRDLARRIVSAGGALVSKFATDQGPADWTFVQRNRLMAGISHAVLIIEARRGSGSLGTADYATDFNRDILAVPGSIFAELSYGTHMLIKKGATPITSSADILEYFGFEVAHDPADKAGNSIPTISPMLEASFSTEQKKIVGYLKSETLTTSDMLDRTLMSSSDLSILLSELELRGIVSETGGRYRLARR